MSDVLFSKTNAVPPDGGCDFAGVYCIGEGRMLATFYNENGQMYTFLSSDNGLSWTRQAPFNTNENIWKLGSIGTALDTYLQGTEGPYNFGVIGVDDGIARTTDAGATWTKAIVTEDLFDVENDFWDFKSFIDMGDGDILAVGTWFSFGVAQHILKSTDGGVSFPAASAQTITPSSGTLTEINCGAYLGNDIVVIGATMSNRSARIYRSTNRGGSWSEIILPNTQHVYLASNSSSIHAIANLGGGIVLACGVQRETSTQFPPKLWRSTDYGENWTEITDSLPGWSTDKILQPRAMVHLGGGHVVLGISARPNELSGSVWRYSPDYGVTWQICPLGDTFTNGDATSIVILYMGVADNGNVAVTMQTGFTDADREIWVGVPSGFEGTGPCAGFTEEGGGGGGGGGGAGDEQHYAIGLFFGRELVVSEIEYEYRWETNAQDFGGVGSRHLIIEVQGRTIDGRLGDIARIEVQNPEPDMHAVEPITTPLLEAVLIDWASYIPLDTDFDHYDVEVGYVNTTDASGNAIALSQVFRRNKEQNNVIVPTQVPIYYRIVPHDSFGPGLPTDIFFATPQSAQ